MGDRGPREDDRAGARQAGGDNEAVGAPGRIRMPRDLEKLGGCRHDQCDADDDPYGPMVGAAKARIKTPAATVTTPCRTSGSAPILRCHIARPGWKRSAAAGPVSSEGPGASTTVRRRLDQPRSAQTVRKVAPTSDPPSSQRRSVSVSTALRRSGRRGICPRTIRCSRRRGADRDAERERDDEDAADPRDSVFADRSTRVGDDTETHEDDVKDRDVADRREAVDDLVVVEPAPVEAECRALGDQRHRDDEAEVEPARKVDDARNQQYG